MRRVLGLHVDIFCPIINNRNEKNILDYNKNMIIQLIDFSINGLCTENLPLSQRTSTLKIF